MEKIIIELRLEIKGLCSKAKSRSLKLSRKKDAAPKKCIGGRFNGRM